MASSFYSRFVQGIHHPTSSNYSILSLCGIFEYMLCSKDAELYKHLVSQSFCILFILELDPIKLVFPWIFYFFIGYFEVEQIYLIFDRIMSSDSLDIIPLTAAAMLHNYREQLLNCRTKAEFRNIFNEFELKQVTVDELISEFLNL